MPIWSNRFFLFLVSVNLHDIVKLLQYLNQQPLATDDDIEHIRLIHSIIESSDELHRKIMKCLQNLKLTTDHLKLLKDLFLHYNAFLLRDLDKTTYLMNNLHGHEKRSCDFYISWFECFLCEEDYVQTERESHNFQLLLKEWSKKFYEDRDLLEKITLKLDLLSEKLSAVIKPETRDQRLNYFCKHMIDIFFQQSKI